MSDDPVGVLATGTGGYGAVQALRRALPHEDVVLVCDHAYAPYPRRPPRVVLDRIGRLAGELAARPVKLLLVASAAATDEGLAFLQARLAPLPISRDGCDPRGCGEAHARWRGARRRRRGVPPQPAVLAGDAQGARAGRHRGRRVAGAARARRAGTFSDSEDACALVRAQLAALGPDVWTALALVCPHSAAVRGLDRARAAAGCGDRRRDRAGRRARPPPARDVAPAGAPAPAGTVDRDVDRSEPGERARSRDARLAYVTH